MGSRRHRLLVGVLPVLPAALSAAVPAAALEPYQTVRSMQLVQDRIADGDHAAMPMQSRVLALADQSMREASPELFDDGRNFEALLVYGMSGGNPVTLDVVMARLKLTPEQKLAGAAVSQYLRGNLGAAAANMQSIETASMPTGARPFMLLVKGSILARDQPGPALQLFDLVRLEAPGTLVEEAALRRSMPAAVSTGEGGRFLQLARQYARRFLRSPYATQFADELVKGIVALHGKIDLAQVEQVIGEMTPAHRKVVYLRLARTSAIDGIRDLSDFAAAKAAEFGGEPGKDNDARAQLYANLTSVASEHAEGALETLRKIDRDQLNAADKQLLDAAMSVASIIIQPTPERAAGQPAKTAPAEADRSPASDEPAVKQPPATDAIPQAGSEPAMSPAGNAAPSQDAVDTGQASQESAADIPADEDAPLAVVTDAKRKLDEIDKLLADDK